VQIFVMVNLRAISQVVGRELPTDAHLASVLVSIHGVVPADGASLELPLLAAVTCLLYDIQLSEAVCMSGFLTIG
jgi:hypothetical protein